MDQVKALLVLGDEDVRGQIADALSHGGVACQVDWWDDSDAALQGLVRGRHDICIVYVAADSPAEARSVVSEAKQAGTKTPIIAACADPDDALETALIAEGAVAAIPIANGDSALRNLVRMAVVMRETENKLRVSNDRLTRDLVTMQDMRERAESVGEQYVELMEELATAKETLAALNDEKNRFFSIVSHDLKSPFTSLLGFTEVLDQQVESLPQDRVREYAGHIHGSATRMFRLLENLLEWAVLQMNRRQCEPVAVNIRDAVGGTLSVLGDAAAQKGVAVRNEAEPVVAWADPRMVDATIRNLVSNAVKFTPKGGEVAVIASDGDDFVQVGVTDTGVGMDEDTLAKLFKLSESVTTPGTGGETGTGLGLLLCKELVERNGGRIWAESQLESGSAFRFTLPKPD